MVGADETTELWRPPNDTNLFKLKFMLRILLKILNDNKYILDQNYKIRQTYEESSSHGKSGESSAAKLSSHKTVKD